MKKRWLCDDHCVMIKQLPGQEVAGMIGMIGVPNIIDLTNLTAL